jgi:dihydropyrimidine dehydrogenase (NAD+) subunit PreA
MTDVSIQLAGIAFQNPLFSASGSATNCGEKIRKMAIEGNPGAIVTKSVSVDSGQKWGRGDKQPTPLCWPWIKGKGRLGMAVITAKGEPYTCEDWFSREMAIAKEGKVPIMPSVSGASNLAEWSYLVQNFEKAGASMLELNFGTPHAGPWGHGACHLYGGNGLEIVEFVKSKVGIPVFVKLPYMSGADCVKYGKMLEEAGADGFVVCMPIQGMVIDIETGIPPLGLGSRSGILPGPPHKPLALYNVFVLANTVKIPIIGNGGICNAKDVVEFIMAGASAVQICTWMMIKGPALFKQINKDLKSWMKTRGYNKIDDFRGISLKYNGIEEYHTDPYTAVVDQEKCNGCGQCETICTWCLPKLPAAIRVDKKTKKARVDEKVCQGCGYCYSHCPNDAISLKDWGKRQLV